MESESATAAVVEDRPLILQAIPKANFELAGDGRVEVPVPKAGDPETQVFVDLEATHAGQGEVWVIARQGQIASADRTRADVPRANVRRDSGGAAVA